MNPSMAAAALACHGIAREAGELTRAALVYPLGCTALGSQTLMRVLVPDARREGRHRTPVVLVHGFGANPSAWFALQRRLLHAGFAHVHAIAYNPAIRNVPAIGRHLVRNCAMVMQQSRTEHVHVVGHSLGGVVVRHAIQQPELAPHVRTAITVATPHRGLPLALTAVVGSLSLGRHSPVDPGRSTCRSGVRQVNFYSDHDLVVRPASARSDASDRGTRDILVPRAGHIGIIRAPAFLDGVVGELLVEEQRTGLDSIRHDEGTRSTPPLGEAS